MRLSPPQIQAIVAATAALAGADAQVPQLDPCVALRPVNRAELAQGLLLSRSA